MKQSQLHTEVHAEALVKFDTALFIEERAGQLIGTLAYRLDLFRASTIATMTTRFVTLLQSCISQPELPIDLLNIISEPEREQHKEEKQKRRKELHSHNDGWLDFPAIDFIENDTRDVD